MCDYFLLFPSVTSTDGPNGQRGLNQPRMNEGIRYPLMKRCGTSFRWRKKFHSFSLIFLDLLVPTGTLCFKMSGKPGLRVLKGQHFPLSWISTLPVWLFIFLPAAPYSCRYWEKTQTLAESASRLPSPHDILAPRRPQRQFFPI